MPACWNLLKIWTWNVERICSNLTFLYILSTSRRTNNQTSKPACKLQVFLRPPKTSVVQQEEEGEDRDSRRPKLVEEADELLGPWYFEDANWCTSMINGSIWVEKLHLFWHLGPGHSGRNRKTRLQVLEIGGPTHCTISGFYMAEELATVILSLFNSAWLRCCEASLGGGQCCCYHPSQVNIIQNSTCSCLFFFPRQPKYTQVYGVSVRFHAMFIMSSMDVFCHISLSKTCLFKHYEASFKDPDVSHTSNENSRPRQCAAWEDSQRTASANAFIGATRKRWRWCDGSGPDVTRNGSSITLGNFTNQALQVGEFVGIA